MARRRERRGGSLSTANINEEKLILKPKESDEPVVAFSMRASGSVRRDYSA